MAIYYIGHFPPPYGGVTIKNNIIHNNLLKYIKVSSIDLGLIKNMNIKEMFKLCSVFVSRSNTLIIGSSGTSRRLFSCFLYYLNRKVLNRSLLILMGGISSRIIAKDPKYLKWVGEFKQVYVETQGMKYELNEAGIKNVSVFPNCREKPKELPEIKKDDSTKIKCLYFSQISKNKGADIVLEAAALLNNFDISYSIDFMDILKMNILMNLRMR